MSSPHIVEVYAIIYVQRTDVEPHISQAALATLSHQRAPLGRELTVVISNDDHLRDLNNKYASDDHATDVLSFPCDGYVESQYIGDIIISIESAERQAHEMGHDLLAEVRLLTVHGTLHLLGHDHANDAQMADMWKAQEDILALLET